MSWSSRLFDLQFDLVSVFSTSVIPKLYADELTISVKKCCIMRVGNRQTLNDGPLHKFVRCNDTLKYVNVVNDLDVLVYPYLSFEAHIDNIVQKASRRCYLIFKSFQSRSTELLVRAFKTYVRPLLEVNSQVWSPHLLKDIRRLEAVRRRFTKKLGGLHTFPYIERLTLLGLERLEVRRIRADLLFVYKLLFGFTALRADDYNFNLSVCTATMGHLYKLF